MFNILNIKCYFFLIINCFEMCKLILKQLTYLLIHRVYSKLNVSLFSPEL